MNSKPIILIAAAALISATSCDRDIESTVQPQHVTFTLSFDGAAASATRATYDGLTGVWEAGDEVYAYLTSTDNVSYGPYTFTPDTAGERATFQAEITGIPDGTRIASIDAYHYDNLNAVAFDNGTISYSLPATADGTLSYMTVSSYDYPSGSEPAASEGGTIDITEALTFTHCLSRIDIETDIPNIRDVTIGIVGGSFPSSGRLDVADGVTTAAATTALLHTTPSDNFQIGIIPVDFGGNRTLRAAVVTTDGKAYTREVTVSAFEKAKRYTLDLSLSTGSGLNEITAVSTEEGLKGLSGKSGDFVLTADITPKNIPHITNFSGTLDGNGYTINISGSESSTTSGQGGIFANTTGDAKISNLDIIGGDRQATMAEGGMLVGLVSDGSTLTIDNVHVSGTITASRDSDASHLFAGGIVGFVPTDSKINISNSSFIGTITIDQSGVTGIRFKNSYVGGIVGCVETGVEDFSKSSEYTGSTNGSTSTITNCTVTDTNLNNTHDGSYDTPWGESSGSEIYTGGIAGRCTGLITNCSVENIVIKSISEGDGSGRQAKPIVGNDWYENSNNADNSYTNVAINDNEASSGTYNGANTAGGVENRYQTK